MSCLRLRVQPEDRPGHGLDLHPRSGRSLGFRIVCVGVAGEAGFGAARELEGDSGTGSYRILGPGRSLVVVIRSLCILGVAGRCRIEKGPGSCMGRYCKAGFDRRSSSVIHLNNSFKWSRLTQRISACLAVVEIHEWNSFSLRLSIEHVVYSDESEEVTSLTREADRP